MRLTHALAFLGAATIASMAAAQPFEIPWYTIDGGGGTSAGGTFSVSGTIGQPDAGTALSGGTFTITGGFWVGGAVPPACPADFNGDGFLDFFDFIDFSDCFEGVVCPPGKTADFDGDGFVDFFDYSAFIDAFETGC
mgnify:FL=1